MNSIMLEKWIGHVTLDGMTLAVMLLTYRVGDQYLPGGCRMLPFGHVAEATLGDWVDEVEEYKYNYEGDYNAPPFPRPPSPILDKSNRRLYIFAETEKEAVKAARVAFGVQPTKD